MPPTKPVINAHFIKSHFIKANTVVNVSYKHNVNSFEKYLISVRGKNISLI